MTNPRHPPPIDVLYLSYDGLMEPLGRSQVLPYLFSLAEQGIRMEVLSFEKSKDLGDSSQSLALEKDLLDLGIRWTRLVYHSRPKVLSTAFDMAVGSWTAFRHVHSTGARLVHARSYLPSLMSIIVKRLTGTRFIFDMRGFWPEERVEMGIFRNDGFLYRLTKFFEKRFFLEADRLIVLTHRAKKILMEAPALKGRSDQIEVIPCCVDTNRFQPQTPDVQLAARHELTGRLVVGNIGAVSSLYLVPQIFRFAFHLKQRLPRLKFVYLTRQDSTPLYRCAEQEGLMQEDILVAEASPENIPEWLSLFQLGIFFPKPCYATQAMCPTKLGEFLAAGVPVVTTSGVGDMDEILNNKRAGVLLRDFSEAELSAAATRVAKMLPIREETREDCRRVAVESFSLEQGSTQYLSVYRALLSAASNEAIPQKLSQKVS